METRKVSPSVPNSLFDYNPDNQYTGKWTSDRYGKDVYDTRVECQFPHNMDGDVVILFDMRNGHSGYLGALWVTNEFENDGIYPYVAETTKGEAQTFEYYQDAVRWLQSKN